MYPTLEYFFIKLLGWNVNLPLPTFGFFVALSFLAAAYVLTKELKLKESMQLILPREETIIVGRPYPFSTYLTPSVIGFIAGYKIIGILAGYDAFAEDPQGFILSTQGNWMGGLAGLIWAYYSTRKDDLKQRLPKPENKKIKIYPHQEVGNITMIAAVAGILGAKLFHNLEEWDIFIQDPVAALLSFSGLSIYGGLIIGGGAVLYYARKKKIPILHLLDAAAPALMLAYAIGRLGCHFSGDGDWGIVNHLPKPSFLPEWLWISTYPNNVIQEGVPIEGCTGKYCTVLPEGVFPTPLYESFASFVFFIILWKLRNRLSPGKLFAIYLMMNGFERFWIEKIRVNPPYHFLGIEATQAEIISVILFFVGLGFYVILHKKINLVKK
jgi:prolipoprotein diacylglyceryl transferase